MIAVTSPGFVLFAALLAGLWYACPPPRRWQLLLGANLLFYAVLCPAALPVLLGSSFLVWWCGRRTAKKPVFLAGLAAALLPLALLKYLPAALGWQGTLANALGTAILRCSSSAICVTCAGAGFCLRKNTPAFCAMRRSFSPSRRAPSTAMTP